MRIPTLVILALISAPVFAQTFYGSIVGTVTDATGASMPQANVTLINLATADRRTAQTDASGNYTFVNLTPGNYRVEVEKTGFRRFAREPITVEVQSAVRIDVPMQVGDVSQTVEVTAQTPLLQTENASLGHVVDARKVLEMPLNGRNVFGLVALVPGVVPGGQSGGNAHGHESLCLGQFSDWRRTGEPERVVHRWRAGERVLRQPDSAGADAGRGSGVQCANE